MQPVPNGPDIPDELFRLHAEGKVVFFCGAGISCPAGLPGFKDLVNKVYARLGQKKTDIEKTEFRKNNFDRSLFLLEKRLNTPDVVRNTVHSILTKKTHDSSIHTTLLNLATTETGKTRIVTTNFDRLFEKSRQTSRIIKYVAPQLPFASHDDWNGIVYLHGLLPKSADPEDLHHLVMSSGDFGAAYLVDRWAARFLVALFTHYTVCFVGYSLNDPIVRYLTDALDASRLHGERQIDHYAFCPESDVDIWRAKGILPIGYKVTKKPIGKGRTTDCHDNLYLTLNTWCDSIRTGDTARTQIVNDCIWRDPRKNSSTDDFVGRLLWALDDPTGEAAKVFAKADVRYSFEWLEEFERPRFNDNESFILPFPGGEQRQSGNIYSFLSRPILSPNGKRAFLSLATEHVDNVSDPVSQSLTEWFANNLSDIRFFFWAVRQQGTPNRLFLRAIHEKLAKTTSSGETSPISTTLQYLWQLYLSGRTQPGFSYDTLFVLDTEIESRGWSPFALEQFRNIAKPVFRLSDNAFVGYPIFESEKKPVGYWMMKLSCIALEWQHHWARWKKKLPGNSLAVLTTAEQLLEEAISMLGNLFVHDEDELFAAIDLFSNDCNRAHAITQPDLALLVRVVRDTWMTLAQNDMARATSFVNRWIRSKHATFKRLALFAAASTNCVSNHTWISWLLKSNGKLLWHPIFKREICRLLVLKGIKLTRADAKSLVAAILTSSSVQKGWTQREIDEDVWVRLVKLSEGGVTLSKHAVDKMKSLSKSNPAFRCYKDQTEEYLDAFHSWEGERAEDRQFIQLPDTKDELLAWIENHSERSDFDPSLLRFVTDDWQKKCIDQPDKCLDVLLKARKKGKTLNAWWYDALSAWEQIAEPDDLVLRLLNETRSFGKTELLAIIEPLASFLNTVAPKCKKTSKSIVDFALFLLKTEQPDEKKEADEASYFTGPGSMITEMLIAFLYSSKEDSTVVTPASCRVQIWEALENACSDHSTFCSSVASGIQQTLLKNANQFFANHRDWTTKHIIPLLKWKLYPKTAFRNWNAFLLCSSFQLDFLREIKQDFFQVAEHLSEFKKSPSLHNYRMLVFWLAHRRFRFFPKKELRKCIARYDQPSLNDFFKRMARAAMHRGAKGGLFWRKTVSRFLEDYLPFVSSHISESISESLATIAIRSGDQFPLAWKKVRPYLRPTCAWYEILDSLNETKQCEKHPRESLELMLKTINTNSNLASIKEFDTCLKAILECRPDLRLRAKPLREFSKKMHTILDP